jgi:hypothetical protein
LSSGPAGLLEVDAAADDAMQGITEATLSTAPFSSLWHCIGAQCLWVSHALGTWHDQRDICAGQGGYLARFEQVQQLQALQPVELGLNNELEPRHMWLGLGDWDEEGRLVWESRVQLQHQMPSTAGADDALQLANMLAPLNASNTDNYDCAVISAMMPSRQMYISMDHCMQQHWAVCAKPALADGNLGYAAVMTPRSGIEAEQLCASRYGGRLARLDTEAKRTLLLPHLNTLSSGSVAPWVGYSFDSSTGVFQSSTGGLHLTTHLASWRFGFPRALSTATCVAWDQAGIMNSQCHEARPFMCEVDIHPRCPPGWSLYERQCYRVDMRPADFMLAVQHCGGQGAAPATVTSVAMGAFLEGLARPSDLGHSFVVGLAALHEGGSVLHFDQREFDVAFADWAGGGMPEFAATDFAVLTENPEQLARMSGGTQVFGSICQKPAFGYTFTLCPPGWLPAGDRCLLPSWTVAAGPWDRLRDDLGQSSFDDANSLCQAWGGHGLAATDLAGSLQLLHAHLKWGAPAHHLMWVGIDFDDGKCTGACFKTV